MAGFAMLIGTCLAGGLKSGFISAVPVWPKGEEHRMNSNVRFETTFEAPPDGNVVLRVAGSSFYRIRLNGSFSGYGPARAAAGFFRIDEWALPVTGTCNRLEIDASAYNCYTYYVPKHPAFLQAEIVSGTNVIAATTIGGPFSAMSTERVTRVPRYSNQRAFSEVYRIGSVASNVYELAECPSVALIDRGVDYPEFRLNDGLKIVSTASVKENPNRKVRGFRSVEPSARQLQRLWYTKDEFEANGWRDGVFVDFLGRSPADGQFPVSLVAGKSVMVDAGCNDCGFYGMTVEVKRPGRLLLSFDEVLTGGEIDPSRLECCNIVEWIFERPGRYDVETMEPYVWRFANLFTLEGEFRVHTPYVRTYRNSQTGRASFRCSDSELEKIFQAARRTFEHNAVDGFTDCPSRERAGWLCDSFFMGRVSKLLTGCDEVERAFLENYALPDRFENLPLGMVPMCYPADHPSGNFIPNWAMWLVLEVEEYLARSGDRAMIDALEPRLQGIVDFLYGFRNSDGVLERLPRWAFIEWSAANKLVQDVNYPSNMLWAETLDAMDRLYGRSALADEARKVREAVRSASWMGDWFCDNARFKPDGEIENTGYKTETCQYYAFFFNIATPESHPCLWKSLVDDFGPSRILTGKHSDVWPSNAFIGNYLRIELLARHGLSKMVFDEIKGYFLKMAERTGTLWEHDRATASCDHGFASHVVVALYRDVLGVRWIDYRKKRICVDPSADLPLKWCEGEIPVSKTETVKVSWQHDGNGKVIVHTDIPAGWSVKEGW